MKIILIGAGQRGRIYANYIHEQGVAEIVALVDTHEGRMNDAAEYFGIKQEMCFSDYKDAFSLGKIADAVIITSMDKDHYVQPIAAIKMGYHIHLEKPISVSEKECIDIALCAKKNNVHIVVCHVLRYTPFFSKLKEIIESKRLGKVISIQHNENIGNFHMAHSFVRGNWNNTKTSSPIILQKTCHDMDILRWLVGASCTKITSVGDLCYFNKENAPHGASEYCINCPVKQTCRFNAEKVYLPTRGTWPTTVIGLDQTEKGIKEQLKTSQYGRCVYMCDNDVCDNQSALIEFENGVTASFVMSAFTNNMCRTIKIMCEHGEIRGVDIDNVIEITPFASNATDSITKEIIITEKPNSGHGGGDNGVVDDFISLLKNESSASLSSINYSIESHLMAFAAEKSRLEGKIVELEKIDEVSVE